MGVIAVVKLIFKGIGLRGLVLMALIGGAAYLSSQGLSKYHQLKSDLSAYEQTKKNDEKEKQSLQQQVDAQRQRAESAESNSKQLAGQIIHQQAENSHYVGQLNALALQKEKDDAAMQKTIQRLNHELSLAGVHNVRVPDPVIGMQQQAICAVNADCAGSNRDKTGKATAGNP